MGPIKGKGRKGEKGKPYPGWAKTIKWGTWSRPFESLPNPAVSPAFGAIRTEFLALVQELDMIWSQTLAADFLEELFSVPRPNLKLICTRGAYCMKRFVLSPYEVLKGLTRLDIGCMEELQFVLIQGAYMQCHALECLSLSRSKELKKALVEARNLKELVVDNCLQLESLMVWSRQLTSLEGLEDSKGAPSPRPRLSANVSQELLAHSQQNGAVQVPPKPEVFHPTLLQLPNWGDKQAPISELEFGLLPQALVVDDDALREDFVYPNDPRFPRTHLQGF